MQEWHTGRYTDQWNRTESSKQTLAFTVNWFSTRVARQLNGERIVFVISGAGTFLVVQWLRLCAPNAAGLGSIPDQGTGSHMPQLSCNMMQLRSAKSLQPCPTLCNPIDGSPPGSPVPGILQARTLEWVAISFSNAWKWKVKVKSLSRVRLLATPWTAATRPLCPWDFPGKSTGVGCHA